MKKQMFVDIIVLIIFFVAVAISIFMMPRYVTKIKVDTSNKTTASNTMDDFYVEKIAIDKNNLLIHEIKVNKNSDTSFLGGYSFDIEEKTENGWKDLEVDIYVPMIGFICENNCTLKGTRQTNMLSLRIFNNQKKYRLVKEIDNSITKKCYNLYSEFILKKDTIIFTNNNSIDRRICDIYIPDELTEEREQIE